MEDNEVKGITIVLFFFGTILFGNIPYFLTKQSKSSPLVDKIISYLNCFAGGVFLGACLLFLFVEGRETLHEYFELANEDVDFPVFECLVACGFFLIALVEQLAHLYVERVAVRPAESSQSGVTQVTEMKPVEGEVNPAMANAAHGPASSTQNTDCCDDLEAVHRKPLRAFIILAALSFHTVFDGLAVGLQEHQEDVWTMFGSIMIHKCLVAVCLGLQLYLLYKDRPLRAFLFILFWAIIAPIGVGIGMSLLSSDIDDYAKHLSRGILEGISTGTFLYVALFEILHDELSKKKGLIRLLLVVVGFGAMCVPKAFHKHEDDDH